MHKKYGLYIGRFQPLHLGHQAIINEIYLDGMIPVIVIGSYSERGTKKNPLSGRDRRILFGAIYNYDSITYVFADDKESNDDWWAQIENKLRSEMIDLRECVLYHYNKEQDVLEEYEFNGEVFKNVHYPTALGSIVATKHAQHPVKIGLLPNATDIREDIEAHKHFLDYRVYRQLKEWGW